MSIWRVTKRGEGSFGVLEGGPYVREDGVYASSVVDSDVEFQCGSDFMENNPYVLPVEKTIIRSHG